MAGRSSDTFKKRQKEVARAEKQQEKMARRLQRKLEKRDPEMASVSSDDDSVSGDVDTVSTPQDSGTA